MTTVVNQRHGDAFDVSIMRPSKWGNPFVCGPDCSVEQAVAGYRVHVKRSGLINDIHELVGLRLGCCCKPGPCHGDVLVELADEYETKHGTPH